MLYLLKIEHLRVSKYNSHLKQTYSSDSAWWLCENLCQDIFILLSINLCFLQVVDRCCVGSVELRHGIVM